jgi:hypothetical protein
VKRPSFQFYPADWRNNAKLRRCSWEARGVWIELLGLLHDSDNYGVLAWPLKEIAQALGAPLKALKELVDKGVLYGIDKGVCEPFIYTPVSGRVKGEPVALVPAQQGPMWFSPRMVRDEYVRNRAGASTRFAPKNSAPQGDDTPPGHSPTHRQGEGQSDGSTSSSSSSSTSTTTAPNGASVDARQRFEMHEGWQPDEVSLRTQLRLAALAPEVVTPATVLEFVAFWITRSTAETQAGWCNRLVAHAKRQATRAAANPEPTASSGGDWASNGVRL